VCKSAAARRQRAIRRCGENLGRQITCAARKNRRNGYDKRIARILEKTHDARKLPAPENTFSEIPSNGRVPALP
jgi:hypothetical protein